MKQDMHVRCYCIIIIIVIDVSYWFSIGITNINFSDH